MKDKDGQPRKARLFWNGRSQAVRLPKTFRFEGDEVLIRREGDAVVLEPIAGRKWPRGFWKWAERHQDELELGDVEPLDIRLLDIEDDGDSA
ncbi:MAG: antitoxin [Gemmatimonadota bacterium]